MHTFSEHPEFSVIENHISPSAQFVTVLVIPISLFKSWVHAANDSQLPMLGFRCGAVMVFVALSARSSSSQWPSLMIKPFDHKEIMSCLNIYNYIQSIVYMASRDNIFCLMIMAYDLCPVQYIQKIKIGHTPLAPTETGVDCQAELGPRITTTVLVVTLLLVPKVASTVVNTNSCHKP